jgi:hypothetical protein
LRRWLREVETLSDVEEVGHICEPESGRNLSDEEEVGSTRDLIDCQASRNKILECQVGKGGNMSSNESSYQKGVMKNEEEARERPRSDEYSHRIMSRVNEDDEKLKTSVTEEEDQRNVLIIGGVNIFLPSDQIKASTGVSDRIERQPTETVMEEKEQALKSIA